MKRPLFVIPLVSAVFLLSVFTTHAQWNTNGNTGASGQWLGTNNAFPLTFKTNNTERASFSSGGVFKLNGLSGTGNALMQVNSSGEVSRFSMGTSSQVLTGNGTWTNISTATGWTTSGSTTYTTNKVGIGTSGGTHALEVSGNGLFTGFVAAEQFLVADVAAVQGRLSFTNNMNIYGYDPIAGTRNEVYTINQPYYIQSAAGYSNNVIIGHANEGKTGIGTNAPSTKLHVLGNSTFEGEASFTDIVKLGDAILKKSSWGTVPVISSIGLNPDFVFNPTMWPLCVDSTQVSSVFNVDGLYTSSYEGEPQMFMGYYGVHHMLESRGTLEINGKCGADVKICPGWSGNNVMLAQSGKVGIGTNYPKTKLDVKTGPFSVYFGDALYSAPVYASSYMGFNVYRHDSTWRTASDGVHNGGAVIYSNVMGDVFITTVKDNGSGSTGQTGIGDTTIRKANLYINASTGNVGIGTTCAPYKLSVEGKIGSREVWVKANTWCDYVFTPEYRRMPLNELEAYIQENKHLPNIPSEKEVLQEGEYSLNQATLNHLEKIEELTLYMIELNKRLEKLERENADLKSQINNK